MEILRGEERKRRSGEASVTEGTGCYWEKDKEKSNEGQRKRGWRESERNIGGKGEREAVGKSEEEGEGRREKKGLQAGR